MRAICNQCAKTVDAPESGQLPPWCPHCGSNLKNCLLQVPVEGSYQVEEPSPDDVREWKERFGKHNVVVGILLFVWGLVAPAAPPESGGDKVLHSHVRLNVLIDALQATTLINGLALVASGVALRRRWFWGYPLAVSCGVVLVVAGFIFLAGFQHLAGGSSLEDGVARVLFVRNNLDMLIGLVDGLGLLWFLSTRLPRYENLKSPA